MICSCSSGEIWEEKKKKRYKALKLKQSITIENAYQKFVTDSLLGKNPKSKQSLEGKLEVSISSVILSSVMDLRLVFTVRHCE